MPKGFMMNGLPFPPKTREVQFDEKWFFVFKREKKCDDEDAADIEALGE
jgi:hypothetical protein